VEEAEVVDEEDAMVVVEVEVVVEVVEVGVVAVEA